MKILALILAAALTACSSGGGDSFARRLPDAKLPTLGGVQGPSLASCPTDKCLTVVVAPWCSVCRAEAPNIVEFRRYMDAKGVAVRVVVGASDDLGAIKEFAAEFGADALLDAGGEIRANSVPMFLVSDRAGRVLKTMNGFPGSAGSEELAGMLGLL